MRFETQTQKELSMEKPTLDKFPKAVLANIDIQKAFVVSRLIVAAERLQIFRLLHGRRMKLDAIGRALQIHKYYLQTFLNSLFALGLLDKVNGAYGNTPFAEKYFIDERSIYWTRQYSNECVEAFEALTVLEKALATGKRHRSILRVKRPSYTEAMKRDHSQAESFTQMLYHFHKDDAQALAKYLDLSQRRAVLDVGGGSGVMSIALTRKNAHLRATILDIAPVCKVAAGNIRRAGLSRRVQTLAGDIHDRLPEGYDVIMFCDIGPVSKQLLRSAYKSLPANGLVVLVDRYFSEDGTKPLDRLVEHFAGSSFGLATWKDMVEAVKSCGFQGVKAAKVYRDVWFITGRKPARRAQP
jgi:predicted O-methyltransferase YrrM